MAKDEPTAEEVGFLAANEDDDNSVQTSNPNYVGVDPMYKNAAYDTAQAAEEGPEAEAEKVAREHEEAMAQPPTPPTHPSDAVNPADTFIDKQRAALDNQAAPASGGKPKSSLGGKAGSGGGGE